MVRLPGYLTASALGTEPLAREVMESHQRERVLDLVTPVFAKRGYQGTTVDDLLAAGKVGVTNFYALFEGKEDCFSACFERIVQGARVRIAAAAADSEDWAGQAYQGLWALVEVVLSEPLAARLVLIEAQSAGPAALGRYNELLDEAIAWLSGGRAAHPAARELPPGFEQAAVSGLAFYLQQCLLDSRRHTTAELAGEAAELILGPIVGPTRLRSLAR